MFLSNYVPYQMSESVSKVIDSEKVFKYRFITFLTNLFSQTKKMIHNWKLKFGNVPSRCILIFKVNKNTLLIKHLWVFGESIFHFTWRLLPLCLLRSLNKYIKYIKPSTCLYPSSILFSSKTIRQLIKKITVP